MKNKLEIDHEFPQKIQYHSQVALHASRDNLSLFKLTIRPYDFYLKYCFQGDLARLQFYQQLEAMSDLIIHPQHISMEQIKQSFFAKWFTACEGNRFSFTFYLKYCNFTLKEWIDNKKECKSIISEEAILFILKQLLSFQKSYCSIYGQNCGVFKSHLVYITTQRCLRIYPFAVDYEGQVARQSESYLSPQEKIDQQISIQTTLSSSRAHYSPYKECDELTFEAHQDLVDIFLLIFQLLTFKKSEQFYSKKHSKIIWDSVNSVLSSTYVAHLSSEFLDLLKECTENKCMDVECFLPRVEKIIESKGKLCKAIDFHKNQELAQLREKAIQNHKVKKMQSIEFLHNESELEDSLMRRHSSY